MFISREQAVSWPLYDVVVCATKCDEYIIKSQQQESLKPCLLLDLSIPRNVDPRVAKYVNTTLLNLEDLGKRFQDKHYEIKKQVKESELLLKETVLAYSHSFEAKQAKVISLNQSEAYATQTA